MWQPVELQIENVLTHKKTHFNFLEKKTILLLGKNEMHKTGANSNGSGKSGIVNGLSLAITGDIIRDVNKEDFIRYGENFCRTLLVLKNKVLNKEMLVDRTVHLKKSQELKVFVNQECVYDTGKDKNTDIAQKFIYDEIGINREDLLNYFIINQDNDSSFFSSNDTKQKEVIARFANFNKLDALIEKKNKEYDSFEQEKLSVNRKIDVATSLVQQYEKDIEELEEDFEDGKRLIIQELEQEIISYKEDLQQKEKQIKEFVKRKKDLNDQIKEKKDNLVDTVEVSAELVKLRSERRAKDEEFNETCKLEGKLNNYVGGLIECPKCNFKFNPKEQELTEEQVRETLEEIEDLKTHLKEELEQLGIKIKRLTEKMSVVNEQQEYIESLEKDLSRLETSEKNTQRDLKSNLEKIEKLKEELKKTEKETEPDTTKEKDKILQQQKIIEECQNKLQEINKEQENSAFFKFHFSNKGFRTYLANKSIKSIQDIVNYYLKKFSIDCQVQINGFTVLKNGDVRDKISVSVLSEGKVQKFGAFSGGEKSRISMCSIVALNKLILNTLPYGKGLDCLILDEMDSMDEKGSEKVLEILNKSKITSVAILHGVYDIPYEHKVILVKEKGITKLLEK